ncbi:MAG: urate hydroxylase PuuD [Hyphomicrobiales bacterium]|nr:urate hydroxylase PuuD [Hyphomicrobiales bacterium]
MTDYPILWEWLTFAVRWAHVIAAIGWIGASFYFIALDLGLRKPDGLPEGVRGEEWQVHGGGFYHVRKYTVAPPGLPEHLIWFKWDSYATWLTGFAMMCVIYYAGAELYLVDTAILDVAPGIAIAISIASLVFGWVVYDLICRSPASKSDTGLMLLLFVVLVAMAWGYTQLFAARAAFLHLGAFTATIMTANVAMIIMPNQRKTIAALKAGREPDPAYGIQAKQRSLHNNYLTLPVIFLMLSTHHPLAFATDYNWLIASLVFLIGVCIRYYFNSYHAQKGVFVWPWLAALGIFGMIIWLSTFNSLQTTDTAQADQPLEEMRFAGGPDFDKVQELLGYRCVMCHTAEPLWEGIASTPKDVSFDTGRDIARHAREIYLQAGISRAMPPANITYMEDSERQLIADWYENAVLERK